MSVRRFSIVAVACAFALALALSASGVALANSARMHWEGISSPGAMAVDEECPVVVEGETLVFDIVDFPEAYYGIDKDPASYSSTVTATYEFVNPGKLHDGSRRNGRAGRGGQSDLCGFGLHELV